LLQWSDIQPGTHITAVGADSMDKQELDDAIIHNANLVVTDSRAQASSRGELGHAFANNLSAIDQVVEIGEIVSGIAKSRDAADEVTVATLSGLAVQDIAIASAVLSRG
jgi:ornithine cyclodeaminase